MRTGTLELAVRWRDDATVLRGYGAAPQAEVLEQCALQLEESLEASDAQTVTAEEAARLANVSLETVRRAVRNGAIADLRKDGQRNMRVRLADIPFLGGKARRSRIPVRSGDTGSAAVAALASI